MERAQSARMAAGPLSRAVGRRPFRSHSACGRRGAGGHAASEFSSEPDTGGFHPGLGHLPIAGHVTLSLRRRRGGVFRRPIFDARDRRHLQRPHGVGRQLEHSVPCDQRRSAGKRSRAGRHDDGVRCAHQPDYRGRICGVFGRDDRVDRPAARRGQLRRGKSARVRRQLGKRRGWPRHPEFIYGRHRWPHAEGRRRNCRSTAASRWGSRGATRARKSTAVSASPKWTAADFKHAFDIDDYDVEGIVSGEYHLYGPYQGPFGFGTLTIDDGIAYGEPFETASGSLRFEGNGVRIDSIQMRKSGGTAEGAAFVGWNGTYSFNATGRRIPMESVKAMAYPQAPLTGLLEFNADGTGTFEVPRYQFRGRIRDLFVSDEGIGEVTGRLDVRGESMTVEIEAASPRLAVSGTGRIDLTEAQDADITLRFTDTSLDPYARAFEPRLSPFTTAVGSGTLRIIGQLANRAAARRRHDVRSAAAADVRLPAAQREADSRADAQQRRANRRHALHRRRHRARPDRHDGHECRPCRRPRARAGEPGHSAGLLSQYPQLRQCRADRAGERFARCAQSSSGARRSRTAVFGTSRCRTRSNR